MVAMRSSLALSLASALLATALAAPAGAAMLEDGVTADIAPADAGPSWLFVDGAWGRIEIGRTEADAAAAGIDAAPRGRGSDALRLSGLPGLAGPAEPSGDRTRVSYFTPRWMGLQAGASVTPDAGARGDGNAVSLALGYREKLGELGVSLGGALAAGDAAAGAADGAWSLGGRLSFGGFELGAGYQEFGPRRSFAAGESDRRFDVGVGFAGTGWQLGAGFSVGWARGASTEGPIGMFSLAGGYTPAAGWNLRADLNFVDLRSGTHANGDTGAVIVISSILTF